ncbi:MAG: ferritin-like domain-containing protein [Myxococcota bacterium]|nr:ferritin-like domain-containing protein [Myxococcota bacterium]
MSPPLDVRSTVAMTWGHRHVAECAASQRYARLADNLRRIYAPEALIIRADRAAQDESRHAELCLTLAKSYGWTGDAVVLAEDSCTAPPQYEGHDAVLYEIVGFCCLSETLNAALMLATLEHTTVARIRDIVRQLLADEVKHGQLGWGMLQWSLGQGRGEFLSEVLVQLLESIGLHTLYSNRAEVAWSDELTAHGELSRRRRQDIFVEAMHSVVFAGFEQAGITTDSTRSWLATFDPRFASHLAQNSPAASR